IMVRYERLGIAAAPTRAIEEDALSKIGFVEPPPPVVQTETARPPVEQLEFDLPIPDGQSTFEDPFAQASAGLLQMDTVEPEISQPDILSSGTLQADIPRLDSQQLDSQQPDSLEFDKLVPMIAPEPLTSKATGELVPAQSNGHSAQTVPDRGERIQISTRKSTRDLKQEQESAPFIVHKESGPLKSEHVVKFNTSDLPAVDPGITDEDLLATVEPPQPEPPIAMAPPERKPVAGTAELVASLLSGIDDSLEDLFNVASRSVVPEPEVELEEALRQREFEEASAAPEPEVTALHAEDDFAIVSEPPVETASEVPPEQPAAAEPFGSWQPSVQAEPSLAPFGAASGPETLLALGLEEERSGADLDGDLRQMFEDLSGNTGSLDPLSDFETHYSLGLAYKDMDLLDEAIEQFQLAFKQSSKTATDADSVQCCHLLGVCFKRKQMPKLAVMWFSRGIKIPNRSEDEYQALRFEVGQCYEEMGDVEKAIDMFSEVYGIDVNYRHVSEKLRQLQAAKNT
ncbi:MAG TPA: tetratricopeptide repeat protein, partial [Blastocatellia bacterium]